MHVKDFDLYVMHKIFERMFYLKIFKYWRTLKEIKHKNSSFSFVFAKFEKEIEKIKVLNILLIKSWDFLFP